MRSGTQHWREWPSRRRKQRKLFEALESRLLLTALDPQGASLSSTLPTITGIYMRGSQWTQPFLEYMESHGQGSSALGFAMPTGSLQYRTLHWANIDTISIVFSEDVNVSENMISIIGGNLSNYDFTVSSSGNIATVTLAQPVGNDFVQLNVSDEVTNLSGDNLDGEWTNGVSTVSGDGEAGGTFIYGFGVLPGDSSGNDIVDLTDLTQLASSWQANTLTPSNWVCDFSGDASVNLTDLTILAGSWQTTGPEVTASATADVPFSTPSNAAVVNFSVVFNKPVTGVDVSDFTLTTAGLSGVAITSVTGSGTNYVVTVNTGAGAGTIKLNLVNNHSIFDGLGFELGNGDADAGFTTEAVVIDHLSPSLVSITPAAVPPLNAHNLIFNVTFSERVVGLVASDFSLDKVGVSGGTVSLSGAGEAYLVTVSQLTGNGTLALRLNPGASITDEVANPLLTGGVSNTLLVDAVPAYITGVYVSSTQWTASFLAGLSASGVGSSIFGYQVSNGANQLLELPWNNLNKISIRFSEPVVGAQNALAVAGANVSLYTIAGYSYDAATNTATWTLASPIVADKLLLQLGSTAVRDQAGNYLDGEWVNGVSTTSGNGVGGGYFAFRVNVLPGDVDSDGSVDSSDTSAVQAVVPATVGSGSYSAFKDLDGDGAVISSDVSAVQAMQGAVLPSGEPTAAPILLIAEEPFSNQSQWNTLNPGGFGTIVAGSATRIVVGASTDPDSRGWSAYIDNYFESYNHVQQTITDTAPGGYMYGYFNFKQFSIFPAADHADSTIAQFLPSTADWPFIGGKGCLLVVRPDGSIGLKTNAGGAYAPTALSLDEWYRIAVQWDATGSSYTFRLFIGVGNGPLTEVASNYCTTMSSIDIVGLKNGPGSGAGGAAFLVSSYRLYQLQNGGSPIDPPGLYAPQAGPFTFYIRGDAAGAADGSANTSSGALTWAEACTYASVLNSSSEHNFKSTITGQFIDPTLYSATQLRQMYQAGQVTIVGDRWLLGTDILQAQSSANFTGEFGSVGNAHYKVSAMVDVAGAVQYGPGAYPNIWMMPSTAKTALFEDGKWMHLAAGVSIISQGMESGVLYASVADIINTIPGTFYNDGTYFYFSTFDGANPNTHAYQRTSNTVVPTNTALVSVNGYIHDVTLEGTALVLPTGQAAASYALLATDSDWTIVDHVSTAYTGFHAAGSLGGTSNGRLTVLNLTIGPSVPAANHLGLPYWFNWGGQVPWISFNGNATATGNQHDLYNVQIPFTDGLVGTIGGFANGDTPAIYSHNAGEGVQYSSISVTDSQVGGAVSLPDNIAQSTLQNVVAAGFSVYNGTGDRLRTTYATIKGMSGDFRVTNSLIAGSTSLSQAYLGGVSFSYCTFDFSNYNDATSDYMGIFRWIGEGSVSIRNSIIIGLDTTDRTLVMYSGFPNSAIDSDYNLFVQSAGAPIFAYNYFNGTTTVSASTLADWQAVSGQDAHSQMISSQAGLLLDADYVPLAGSPAIGASSDGLAIGAFQPVTPASTVAGATTLSPITFGAAATTSSTSLTPVQQYPSPQTLRSPAPTSDPLDLRSKTKLPRKLRR